MTLSGAMSRDSSQQWSSSRLHRSSTLDPVQDHSSRQILQNMARSEDLNHSRPSPPFHSSSRPSSPSSKSKQPSALGHSDNSHQSSSSPSDSSASKPAPSQKYVHPSITSYTSRLNYSQCVLSMRKAHAGAFCPCPSNRLPSQLLQVHGPSLPSCSSRNMLIVSRIAAKSLRASSSQSTAQMASNSLYANGIISVVSTSSVQNATWPFVQATSLPAVRCSSTPPCRVTSDRLF